MEAPLDPSVPVRLRGEGHASLWTSEVHCIRVGFSGREFLYSNKIHLLFFCSKYCVLPRRFDVTRFSLLSKYVSTPVLLVCPGRQGCTVTVPTFVLFQCVGPPTARVEVSVHPVSGCPTRMFPQGAGREEILPVRPGRPSRLRSLRPVLSRVSS